jgi:hypothetical protein
MKACNLRKILQQLKKRATETGKRLSYWITEEELRFLLCAAKYDTCSLNVCQGDGTYKTVILVDGLKYQYVGEKIEC